ncbi:MAG: glycosyltransferase [Paracoccaceae bacterium]
MPREPRPISFFVHAQGRGHVRRVAAIIARLDERPVHVLTVDPAAFGPTEDHVTVHALPATVGVGSASAALFAEPTPSAMHCMALGSRGARLSAAAIAQHLAETDPGLFVVDVSVEIALLGRLCSVPVVSMRMHGERADDAHRIAYEAGVGQIAPFDERLEQDDFPARERARTFYAGGLCPDGGAVVSKAEARAALGLDPERRLILAMAGGGGQGSHYAALTVGARAIPDALWVAIGPLYREGHETDFPNLRCPGWVARPDLWLSAADVVVASAGDTTVHEIARAGRPYLCIPEWRYFAEQTRKAEALARLGAAHVLPAWPGGYADWRAAIAGAGASDVDTLRSLWNPDAAAAIARHLIALDARLWDGAEAAAPARVA